MSFQSFIDCSNTDHPIAKQLYASYQELLSKPEAAILRDDPPKLYYMMGGTVDDMGNAAAAARRQHKLIVMGGLVASALTEKERKSVLAHELAHHILYKRGQTETGFFAHMNEKNERWADKLTARLMDYDVEPFISALLKITKKMAEIQKIFENAMKEETTEWHPIDEDLKKSDIKTPAAANQVPTKSLSTKLSAKPDRVGPSLFRNLQSALFAVMGTAAYIFHEATDRSHPKDWSRAYYLREEAKKHMVANRVSV